MMKSIVLELNLLELITLAIAIISIAINIYQYLIWRKDQTDRLRPLSNGLIALFNDIKAKQVNVYRRQQILFSSDNPHEKLDTLRWDYAEFTDTIISYLQGLHEQVVGLLVTLNPDDVNGERVFRSQEYGLTLPEREMRQRNAERMLDNFDQQQGLSTQNQANDEPAADQPQV